MNLTELIQTNGLNPGKEEFLSWVRDFRQEMKKGLAGEDSSLRMLLTYLSTGNIPEQGEPVIVLDAGGTNLRVALMEFGEEGPKESYFQTCPMLGTRGQLTIEEFYDGLAALIAPIADKSDRIGFCFSFPCEILPNLDGKIIHFDKEVDIAGAEGSVLGPGLRKALEKLGKKHDHKLAVINDTVAAMLGLMAQEKGQEFMGFILGTGTNICASFPNAMMGKAPGVAAKEGTTVVNLESGGFNKIGRSAIDLAFDATTAYPGTQVLEKLISGGYQGPMAQAYLKAAAAEGIFSPQGTEAIRAMSALEAKDISGFLLGQECGELEPLAGEDKEKARQLFDGFFRRAARLTAATLGAVMEETDMGRDKDHPCKIAAEGTAFYRCPLLNKYILEDMETLVAGVLGRHGVFMQCKNPNLTGSALAALAAE